MYGLYRQAGMQATTQRRQSDPYGPELITSLSQFEANPIGNDWVDNGNGTWTFTNNIEDALRPGIRALALNPTDPRTFYRVELVSTLPSVGSGMLRVEIIAGDIIFSNNANWPNFDIGGPTSGSNRRLQFLIDGTAPEGASFTVTSFSIREIL